MRRRRAPRRDQKGTRMSTAAERIRSALAAALMTVLLVFLATPSHADVIGDARVLDGDTIDIAGERVRLHGIDAPETRQTCSVSGVAYDCGRNATRMLSGMVGGQEVTCKGKRRDRYGRLLAVCYVGDEDVNAKMVRDGWALAYRRYAKDYIADETEARASGSGLWRGQFVEPWEWRKQAREAN
jgi:endonuclease YncB( thermonuclease family)